MHEEDGAGAQARLARFGEGGARARFVEGSQRAPVGGDALVDLDDALEEHIGQNDMAVEQARAVLIADAQRVGETAGW